MAQIREISVGWVYVLSNPSMPQHVKVGYTDRDVAERVRELSGSTGVPRPFVWEYGVKIPDARSVEQAVHRALADCRAHQGREFFDCDVPRAIEAILRELGGIDPQEVFDLKNLTKTAEAVRKESDCLFKWRDDYQARLRSMRVDLEREVGDEPFLPPFLGYGIASAAVLAFLFGSKGGPGILIAAALVGAVLATMHQSRRQDERKESIRYQPRLDEITKAEHAVQSSHGEALDRIRKGVTFAEVQAALPRIPGQIEQRPAEVAMPPARSPQDERSKSAPSSPPKSGHVPPRPPAPTPASATATPAEEVGRPTRSTTPFFFKCDQCRKTLDLNRPVDCGRLRCQAMQVQSKRKTEMRKPVEPASWQAAGPQRATAAAEASTSAASSRWTSTLSRTPPSWTLKTETRYCVYCRSEGLSRVEPNGDVVCLRCRNAL